MMKIAVLLCGERTKDGMYDFSSAKALVEKLKSIDGVDACIYSSMQVKDGEFGDVPFVKAPDDASTFPKLLNYAVREEKAKPGRECRWLHAVQDCVQLQADPCKFTAAVEKMMQCLKLKTWLSTTCDQMNYVYTKYNPRLCVHFSQEDAAKVGNSEILFTSNANTAWMCFDLDAGIDDLKFNEEFTQPMYYIIEFLARRRAKAASKVDFMNMYPTVPEEHGVLKMAQQSQPSEDMLKDEYEKFMKLGLDLAPTNNIDQVLEAIYSTINNT